MAAWLTYPLQLEGMRMFECDDLSPEECSWYMHRWHFWYIADHVFALPTVAFFMCAIGIFILGHVVSSLVLRHRRAWGAPIPQKPLAAIRYLSYRGFHIRPLRWNSASVGVLLLGITGTIFFFCMDLIPQPYYWADEKFGGSPPLATRSGWLSLGCMPFVFATASKANWITLLTGVSHERLQVFHRWISYAFFILALLHTFPFIVYHVRWHDMEEHFSSSLLFYWTGIVAIIFQTWLTFASHSTIRNLGYEFFKATHFLAVVVFMITFFWHCDYTLTSWDYFVATAAIYVPCFIFPWLRTVFEYGLGQRAHISVEDNGFTRITIPFKSDWKPGQHCFLRFTGFGFKHAVSTHPFTICSSPPEHPNEPSELVFYIRHQRGFTSKLYQHALDHPGISVSVLVDGPYGGVNMRKFYEGDHLLVIAGGSGAGWCLPLIERFARHHIAQPHQKNQQTIKIDGEKNIEERNTAGPISLHVILATRDISSRVWFLRTVSELLSKSSAADSPSHIRIQVYLTGDAAKEVDLESNTPDKQASAAVASSSSDKISITNENYHGTVPGKEFEGRPLLPLIVHEEAAKLAPAGQSLSVFVCGPDTMLNDVRNAVAKENLDTLMGKRAGKVYLHSEHFSWA